MESAENTRNFYEKFLKFKIGTRVYEWRESLRQIFYRVIYSRIYTLIYLVPQNRTKTKENGSFYKFLLEVTLFVCKFIYYFCQL